MARCHAGITCARLGARRVHDWSRHHFGHSGQRGARMSRQLGVFGVVLITSLVGVAERAAAQAQVSGTIVGRVTDESGAVLPGVSVTATSPALQVPQIVDVTNAQGDYRITPLPIGTYEVVFTLSGFQTVRRESIRLTAGFVARVHGV